MPKNEPLLIAASHFWSDAINAFIFGHGPMTITLADIFMMTGLGVSGIPYPDKYKGKSSQKAIKPGGGWSSYIQTYMESGSISDKEYKAFLNMWLCRFVFCGKANEPTLNYLLIAEDLAVGTYIPLGKYLLGTFYHMMHQISNQMRSGDKIIAVNGPWWLLQMWVQLYMHQIIFVNLYSLSFPSINYAEDQTPTTKGCQTYGEAASAINVRIDSGHLFKLFYKGFGSFLWLPYRENEDITLPCKFNYETGCDDKISTELFNSFIKPCALPAEFHHGWSVHPIYEFYNPNMVARQLGCGQLPPKLFFSEMVRPREEFKEKLEYKRVFELGWNLPSYEPSPFAIIDIAHPTFSSWWQNWHSYLFKTSVHPLCQKLEADFESDSEVITLIFSPLYSAFIHVLTKYHLNRILSLPLPPGKSHIILLVQNLLWDGRLQPWQY